MTGDVISLDCRTCATSVRVTPSSAAELVRELRAFFVAHPGCATSVGLPRQHEASLRRASA